MCSEWLQPSAERKPRTSRREKDEKDKTHKKLKMKCQNYMEDVRQVETYHQVRSCRSKSAIRQRAERDRLPSRGLSS